MVFLLFSIGDDRYALESQQVVEVVPLVHLWQIAKMPAYVAGMFTYRGQLVPVVDLCQFMHSRPCPVRLSTRIILTDYHSCDGTRHILGLMAEHVTDTISKAPAEFALPGISAADAPYLGGVLADEHGILQRVRVEHLFPASVSTTLFGVLEN